MLAPRQRQLLMVLKSRATTISVRSLKRQELELATGLRLSMATNR
nr:MAG TPA: hypothetical protein [Caudoviricetes sp.]